MLKALVEGYGTGVIAGALGISSRTVEVCRAMLLTKLGVRSLTAAVRVAFAAGMILLADVSRGTFVGDGIRSWTFEVAVPDTIRAHRRPQRYNFNYL